jgi:hypothetical protein
MLLQLHMALPSKMTWEYSSVSSSMQTLDSNFGKPAMPFVLIWHTKPRNRAYL